MKKILLVPDGAADLPLLELNGRTPLEAAHTPNLDSLAQHGFTGAVQVTPSDMYPGSDAANMALLGYNPVQYYTGRGPVEAAAMGIELGEQDAALRCSLISTNASTLLDYSSGHIPTEEALLLIDLANQHLCKPGMRLFPGISYRHILRWTKGPIHTVTAPPHENMGRPLSEILPAGEMEAELRAFIEASFQLLDPLPYNKTRRENGLPPANMLWPWSPGRTPLLPPFQQMRACSGALIAAVDVVRGLARLAGLEVVDVPGATGYFDTNYKGKGEYALQALQKHDFVWVHVEAPDEAGHAGSAEEKVRAIENFDRYVVGTLLNGLNGTTPYRLLCVPDHMTPVATRKHAAGPVPYLFYDSQHHQNSGTPWDERVIANGGVLEPNGYQLIERLFTA